MGKIKKEEYLDGNNTGETPLDDVSGLIPLHITTRPELNEAEFINIAEASQYYLFNINVLNKFKVTKENLFEVHKKMFYKVWDWAGKKRKSNKNIGVPAYKIDEEIKKLIDDYNFWLNEKMDNLGLAARVHHRLVYIHPFEGGNGRWSRLVANILCYKNTKRLIKWPENELQLKKKSSFRDKYLKALKEADHGSYDLLTKLHKEII